MCRRSPALLLQGGSKGEKTRGEERRERKRECVWVYSKGFRHLIVKMNSSSRVNPYSTSTRASTGLTDEVILSLVALRMSGNQGV